MTEEPAPVGLIVVRGLGYGALLGLLGGYLLLPISQLILWESFGNIGIAFLIGFLAAPIGLMYGCVAGVAVALAFLPFRNSTTAAVSARVVAAIVGPLAVSALSWWLFDPSFQVGPNETTRHVVEDTLLFFGIPCGSALLAGALFGGRLARANTIVSTLDPRTRQQNDWTPPAA